MPAPSAPPSARAGQEVLLVDLAAEHVAACRQSGLYIEGPVDSFSVQVDAVTPDELTGRFSRIVLAVKAHHTVAAVTALHPHLTDDGFVLSAQNGLNERVIAQQLGVRRHAFRHRPQHGFHGRQLRRCGALSGVAQPRRRGDGGGGGLRRDPDGVRCLRNA